MEENLCVLNYVDQLRNLSSRYIQVEIEIVPNIFKWCEEKGVSEDHPFRIAKALKNLENGRYLILINQYLTSENISSVLTGIEHSNYFSIDQIKKITDQKIFLIHLLLHEISHVLDETRTEEQCDHWALNQIETNQLTLD
ncbi:MAG: hypothetical protein WA071_04870 [Undibacterium umbellatum]|uniref:hypothetical protein n=1 Tax=Undibacterium umbellatum TaxID=2762300 RepID=UPI003BB60AAF